MSKDTKIQWTDSTVNPVMGCTGCELFRKPTKDDPGVSRCYAAILHERRNTNSGFSPDFSIVKLFPGRMAEAAKYSCLTGQPRLDRPWLNDMPRMIFVSDMGDALSEGAVIDNDEKPLGNGVAFDFLKQEIIDVVTSDLGKRHIWQWLTKRPKRMAEFAKWLQGEFSLSWPDNLWPGTSVTTTGTLGRIEALMAVGGPDTVRIISVEPQLDDISLAPFLPHEKKWWVVQGGESAQGEPPGEFKLEWARKVRNECFRFNVPYFLKQLGSKATENGVRYSTHDKHGGDWNEWPDDLRIRQMPSVIRHVLGVKPSDLMPVRRSVPKPIVQAQPGNWSARNCQDWASNAKLHVLVAIRALADDDIGKSTAELNAVSSSRSGGAIVGGLLAWAKGHGLPPPLCRMGRSGGACYRFVSPDLRAMFGEALRNS